MYAVRPSRAASRLILGMCHQWLTKSNFFLPFALAQAKAFSTVSRVFFPSGSTTIALDGTPFRIAQLFMASASEYPICYFASRHEKNRSIPSLIQRHSGSGSVFQGMGKMTALVCLSSKNHDGIRGPTIVGLAQGVQVGPGPENKADGCGDQKKGRSPKTRRAVSFDLRWGSQSQQSDQAGTRHQQRKGHGEGLNLPFQGKVGKNQAISDGHKQAEDKNDPSTGEYLFILCPGSWELSAYKES